MTRPLSLICSTFHPFLALLLFALHVMYIVVTGYTALVRQDLLRGVRASGFLFGICVIFNKDYIDIGFHCIELQWVS